MIKLKTEFRKNGVNFFQIYRDDEFMIYRARQKHLDDGVSEWYEVVKPTMHKANAFHDDDFEMTPFDEIFGKWAWSCSDAGVVAKVIYKNFKEHHINKMTSKYIDGYYSSGGELTPYFKITSEELAECLR